MALTTRMAVLYALIIHDLILICDMEYGAGLCNSYLMNDATARVVDALLARSNR